MHPGRKSTHVYRSILRLKNLFIYGQIVNWVLQSRINIIASRVIYLGLGQMRPG